MEFVTLRLSLKSFNADTNTDLRGHKHITAPTWHQLRSPLESPHLLEDVNCSLWSLRLFPSLLYMTPTAFPRTEISIPISIPLIIKAANPTHRRMPWRGKISHMLNVEHSPHFKLDLPGYPCWSSAPNHLLCSEI